jgi:hypothetical protein
LQLEKKNMREQQRKQKEAEKRNKNTLVLKLREVEPPDDLDIEWAVLRDKWLAAHGGSAAADGAELAITRPPFPPESVTRGLVPAFTGAPPRACGMHLPRMLAARTCRTCVSRMRAVPQQLHAARSLRSQRSLCSRAVCAGALADNCCELGGQFLMLWSFVADFSALIAFRPVSVQELMEAVQGGSLSLTLVNLHVALIRFIQSEAEIANAIGSVHVRPTRILHAARRP